MCTLSALFPIVGKTRPNVSKEYFRLLRVCSENKFYERKKRFGIDARIRK